MKRITFVVGLLVVALIGAFTLRAAVTKHPAPLVIVHWANSHPMRDGLLPQMAEQFNHAGYETASGRPIEIKLVSCDSAVEAEDLVSRATGSGPLEDGCEGAGPTIVTPQADDWLVSVNDSSGRTVVDLARTKSIAKTWVGIVTYRAMAECLGWPARDIGYADIIALRSDPEGWRSHADCAQAEWGPRPLLAFTNPSSSTTGRSVLISLYSMAANKAPGDLKPEDVENPDVQSKVKEFQQLVDHYMPGTIPLNTKIDQGTRYGHFFLMPEDNLVNLYNGTEKAIGADGKEQPVRPQKNLVMIYPKEGSALNSNPAGIVDAPWVSGEETESARTWIEFLREDEQQRAFMRAGFRPGTDLRLTDPISSKFGLDPKKPNVTIDPADLDPAVLQKIMNSWGAVKKPAIVTFVVDTSGSMEGTKIEQAKEGLIKVLDNMEDNNQVGLVTFSGTVNDGLPPKPLRDAKFDIAEVVTNMTARGDTALYDAVRRGIEMSDRASVSNDANVTRAVVVLSDGEATAGEIGLDSLISMNESQTEANVAFRGWLGDVPTNEDGNPVKKAGIVGENLLVATNHPVQIFFIGFGDADINVGRVLAQATGGEFQGSTDKDLSSVLEALGPTF